MTAFQGGQLDFRVTILSFENTASMQPFEGNAIQHTAAIRDTGLTTLPRVFALGLVVAYYRAPFQRPGPM
jgi:hypothetical protein